jgi:hypothetical protein
MKRTGIITAKQNVDAGYADTVCVKCQNSAGSIITYDNFLVEQKPNCATLAPITLTNKEYAYDASATTTAVYYDSQVYSNSNTTGCPILNCSLT